MRAKNPAAGRFLVSFWKKMAISIWITFRTFSEPFERTKFLRFEPGTLDSTLVICLIRISLAKSFQKHFVA